MNNKAIMSQWKLRQNKPQNLVSHRIHHNQILL